MLLQEEKGKSFCLGTLQKAVGTPKGESLSYSIVFFVFVC